MRLTLVLAVAACGAPPRATRPAPRSTGARAPAVGVADPPRNDGPPALPLPACPRRAAEPDRLPWDRPPAGDCLGVARAVDGGWVTLTAEAIERFGADGQRRWHTELDHTGPDGRACGYPAGLAIDGADRIAVSCGYSLLSYAPSGAFRWQVWPGGNRGISAPLVAGDGTIFVAVGGDLYAVATDGATRWRVETGANRYLPAFAPTADGELVFATVMDELHSDPIGANQISFYYDFEPPELFVVDRAGKIVRREPVEDLGAARWPAWVEVVGEGGGRLPVP